ncbi:PulJ/GspJ family protein [Aliivibrio finisterrensis]|uniref:Prepilin-type N-terminal cleavage/methylation domain-containing protein n=1 Tax=Aliivibrio finisterrensis TaxID=511998 RepID=A0A6N6RWQ1_9GAMM|nr:prepilin-type N-terminal cleavage/methylation domain-containing protein [Aliivibrio finisterrensis]KAB2826190.1 prepilin-type N-terminal cleavage/methylation domain-containing protein [Aliivibrio finisterrensis]
MTRSLGFTLLEMIVSIVLLAVVGLSLSAIIQHSMSIYADTTTREELLLQGRFVTERMHKEIRDAVPNSVQINQTTQCIEWLPITNTAVYEALPLAPESANTMRVLPEHGFVQSERVVIMPINAQDLLDDIPSNGVDRVAEVKNNIDFTPAPEATTVEIEFTQETSFTANSPAHRLFAYKTPVAYCLEDSLLYRYANYPLSRSELSPAELSAGDRELMAEKIKSVQFDVKQASLVRNGLVKLQFVFSDNNEEVRLDHDVLIANTP